MKIKIGEFILFACALVSGITMVVLSLDSNQPEHYFALISMPTIFLLASLVFRRVYDLFLKNLGVSIMIALLFLRMVVSPLLMGLGGYAVTITKNIEENTFKAILLVLDRYAYRWVNDIPALKKYLNNKQFKMVNLIKEIKEIVVYDKLQFVQVPSFEAVVKE